MRLAPLPHILLIPQVELLKSEAAADADIPRGAAAERADVRGSVPAAYLRYAAAFIKQYDRDGDGKLNADERLEMDKDCSGADTNKDGLVTATELARYKLPAHSEAHHNGSGP